MAIDLVHYDAFIKRHGDGSIQPREKRIEGLAGASLEHRKTHGIIYGRCHAGEACHGAHADFSTILDQVLEGYSRDPSS